MENKAFEELQTRVSGYDLSTALTYCAGSEDFLAEMLRDFADADFEGRLFSAYASGDKDQYRITAHSLKSTSLTVGFTELSEKAKELEAAVKEDRWDYVEQHHGEVVELYGQVVNCIRELWQ